MEFRKYSTGVWPTDSDILGDEEAQNFNKSSKFLRRAIYLPPRSMLLLSREARYAWHHYIPHHKVTLAANFYSLIALSVSPPKLISQLFLPATVHLMIYLKHMLPILDDGFNILPVLLWL